MFLERRLSFLLIISSVHVYDDRFTYFVFAMSSSADIECASRHHQSRFTCVA